MTSIVLVTYNWPPRNAIGTHRPYAWAKYWAKHGNRVTVLTARKQAFDQPLDLVLPPIEGVEVVEADVKLGMFPRMPMVSPDGWTVWLKTLKRLLRRRMGIVVDPRDGWTQGAEEQALRLARTADFVVSTFGPRSSHLIAAQMKRANPELTWIADYRDLWSQSHLAEYSARARARERKVEREALRHADMVTTVSDELAADLSRMLGKPTHVVPNGFEADDWVRDRVPGVQFPRRIVYTGLLYPKTRDPETLLRAVRELADEGKLRNDDIRIDFLGPETDWLPRLVRQHGVEGVVRIHGRVGRDAALAAQRTADRLLLLESGSPEADGVLTGKLFEYFAAGRPILSMGSSSRSAIARVLRKCRVGICVEDDISLVKQELLRLMEDDFPAWFQPDQEQIGRYTREGQAARMIQLMSQAKSMAEGLGVPDVRLG